MFKRFFPMFDAESPFELPYADWVAEGKKGIIFDIDNTLVLHDVKADEASIALFKELRKIGLKTCLLSNNHQPRVEKFQKKVGGFAVWDGHKPKVTGYEKALKLMNLNKGQAVFVGDQLFTDILGANRAGITSVLVRPRGPEKYFHIKLKRLFERYILKLYRRSKKGSK
ncbi:MAG: YqeG family HAD IIIA-type phosphatase [Lachnospiraceae bacterium]|nr:YqeG family HAD IIIA-type phosphatase [Lachnospiraceae bacterium]